ncbi:MAG: hypothetical protein ACJ74J_02750 [Blastocatellia bacterium]
MDKQSEKENLIARYFSGELSEEEASRIEQQFLTDSQFFELMLSIENALIDDYVRGKLAEPERRKVEAFLQSSNRLARETEAVKQLIDDLAKTKTRAPSNAPAPPQGRPSRWQSLLAMIGIRDSGKRFSFALLWLPTLLASGLLIWNLILQHDLSQIKLKQVGLEENNRELARRLDTQTDHNDKLGQEIEAARRSSEQVRQEVATMQEAKTAAPVEDTATLALTIEAFTRGQGALKEVHIGRNTRWLRMRIDTGRDDFTRYGATLRTFDGQLIWSEENLRPALPNRSRIVLTLPGKLFVNQDYTLTLVGQTDGGPAVELGDYSFRVKP